MKRNSCFHNYETAKTIVLLFDASQQEDYKTIISFSKKLAEKGLKPYLLGINYTKELNDFYQTGTQFYYFSPKDFYWYGAIKSPVLNDLLTEKWHILINFDTKESYFSKAIMSLSQAEFKIGPKKSIFYDFIINTENNKSLAYFIEQIDFYLKMIKK